MNINKFIFIKDIILIIYSHLQLDDIINIYRLNKTFYRTFKIYEERNELEVLIYKKDLEDYLIFKALHPKIIHVYTSSIRNYRYIIGETSLATRTAIRYQRTTGILMKKDTSPIYTTDPPYTLSLNYIYTDTNTFNFIRTGGTNILDWCEKQCGSNESWWIKKYLYEVLEKIPNPFETFPLTAPFLYITWIKHVDEVIKQFFDTPDVFLKEVKKIKSPPAFVDVLSYVTKIQDFVNEMQTFINEIERDESAKKKRNLNSKFINTRKKARNKV